MNKSKGFFLTFEGPEASGKSSQIKLLEKYLNKNKIPFITTREPGGTKLSESLRNLILKVKESINVEEEILMLMAARSHHIENVIKPAMKNGKFVISDRFADSTFVYQGYVNKFGIKRAKDLHKKMLSNFLPFKTFMFILPIKEIIKRLKKRNVSNKYDKIETSFHKDVMKGYMKISKNDKRFILINALDSSSKINEQIIKILNKILKK